PVNLKREKILPLGATDVEPRGLPFGCPQIQKGIVIHRHVPEIRRRLTLRFCEGAEKPAGEINQMDSLIKQFTAPGKFRVGAPFLVVTHTPAVAVTRANEHQFAHHAGPKNLPRLDERRMITMIETDADANSMLLRERNKFV